MKPLKRRRFANHVRGWLPQRPLPSMHVHNKPKKFFAKRNILLFAAGIIISMFLSGAIFFETLSNSFPNANQEQEAQNTVIAYINALNNYNATAAWGLMSPNMQASYGTIQNYIESFVSQLQESGWHAQVIKNDFEYGTIAEYCLFPFQNSCQISTYLKITQNNSSLTNLALTFELKTYAFNHNHPSDWKIDSKPSSS